MKDERFYRLFVWVASRKDLTPAAKLVYAVLGRLQGDNADCWPGLQWVADACGLCEDTARNATEQLERTGLLTANRTRGGRRRTNHYSLAAAGANDGKSPPLNGRKNPPLTLEKTHRQRLKKSTANGGKNLQELDSCTRAMDKSHGQQQQDGNASGPPGEPSDGEAASLLLPFFDQKTAEDLAAKYGSDRIERAVQVFEARRKAGKVKKNEPGYLRALIENGAPLALDASEDNSEQSPPAKVQRWCGADAAKQLEAQEAEFAAIWEKMSAEKRDAAEVQAKAEVEKFAYRAKLGSWRDGQRGGTIYRAALARVVCGERTRP